MVRWLTQFIEVNRKGWEERDNERRREREEAERGEEELNLREGDRPNNTLKRMQQASSPEERRKERIQQAIKMKNFWKNWRQNSRDEEEREEEDNERRNDRTGAEEDEVNCEQETRKTRKRCRREGTHSRSRQKGTTREG